MSVRVEHGDCLEILPRLAADGVMFDAVVTDPPYHLTSIVKRFRAANAAPAQHGTDGAYDRASRGFMGKTWDGGNVAFRPETWAEVFRVMKPGAHLFAFSGTRTYHRMACAIEDAGFEVRDQFAWVYGSGFPKSHDVSKAIDKHLGHERKKVRVDNPRNANMPTANTGASRPWLDAALERGYHEAVSPEAVSPEAVSPEAVSWSGWGTAAKPAWEPIVLARKPLIGTVAANVLAHGTGALNIDGCRVESGGEHMRGAVAGTAGGAVVFRGLKDFVATDSPLGRWPANIVHDGSEEVLRHFPETRGQQRAVGPENGAKPSINTYGDYGPRDHFEPRGDAGNAARFFYTAKADEADRLGSKHPTVKPVDLIAYLCRLITPPGGLILDPFAGSGTTGMACLREGFRCVLIEREAEYVADIERRLKHVRGADTPLFAEART